MKVTPDDMYKALQIHYPFNTLPDDDINIIISLANFRTFNKDEYLFYQEDEVKYLYFIIDGAVDTFSYTDKESVQAGSI